MLCRKRANKGHRRCCVNLMSPLTLNRLRMVSTVHNQADAELGRRWGNLMWQQSLQIDPTDLIQMMHLKLKSYCSECCLKRIKSRSMKKKNSTL